MRPQRASSFSTNTRTACDGTRNGRCPRPFRQNKLPLAWPPDACVSLANANYCGPFPTKLYRSNSTSIRQLRPVTARDTNHARASRDGPKPQTTRLYWHPVESSNSCPDQNIFLYNTKPRPPTSLFQPQLPGGPVFRRQPMWRETCPALMIG